MALDQIELIMEFVDKPEQFAMMRLRLCESIVQAIATERCDDIDGCCTAANSLYDQELVRNYETDGEIAGN